MFTAVTDWSEAILTSLAGAMALFFAAVPKVIAFGVILVVALDSLGLPAVSDVLRQLLLWLPNLAVGIVVLIIGGLLANAAFGLLRGSTASAGFRHAELIGNIGRVAVNQIGIAQTLVNTLKRRSLPRRATATRKMAATRILFAVLAALALHSGAWAADELKPEQQRMRACNTRADQKGLKAGERNHFLQACLKGAKGNGKSLTPHQQRSQACSDKARSQRLEGAARRGFVSECEKPPVKQTAAQADRMKDCASRADKRRLEGEDREDYLNGCRNALKAAAVQ